MARDDQRSGGRTRQTVSAALLLTAILFFLPALVIRGEPAYRREEVTQAPNGAPLTVINQYRGWYVVRYEGIVGWANGDFVTLV